MHPQRTKRRSSAPPVPRLERSVFVGESLEERRQHFLERESGRSIMSLSSEKHLVLREKFADPRDSQRQAFDECIQREKRRRFPERFHSPHIARKDAVTFCRVNPYGVLVSASRMKKQPERNLGEGKMIRPRPRIGGRNCHSEARKSPRPRNAGKRVESRKRCARPLYNIDDCREKRIITNTIVRRFHGKNTVLIDTRNRSLGTRQIEEEYRHEGRVPGSIEDQVVWTP